MPKAVIAAAVLLVVPVVMVSAQRPAESPATPAPTFSRDVAPILNRNCVTCHRPGEAAPMSFVAYADARPWARAMARQVAAGTMPPWHADAPAGTFENERVLTAQEKDVIERWANGGAPEGNPADLPARPTFADGWRIGTPDVVFEMAEDYAVPASGTIEYEYFYLPTNFTDAKWLQAIEVRPGSRAHVHHVLVYYIAPPEPAAARAVPVLRPVLEHNRLPPVSRERGVRKHLQRRPAGQTVRLLATYAPGTEPQVFRPGSALRLPLGGTIELQLHYTATGKPGTDRTKVGLMLAKTPPADEIRATQFVHAQFTIPAGVADHRVDTNVEFLQDATIWGIFPHTHVRGKRWEYILEMPDGTKRPLLSVPKYDFNWQTYYMFKEPVQVPRGARIVSSAWYDNSAANRSNPDPKVDVTWGDQTWEEMQYTGLLFTVRAAPAP